MVTSVRWKIVRYFIWMKRVFRCKNHLQDLKHYNCHTCVKIDNVCEVVEMMQKTKLAKLKRACFKIKCSNFRPKYPRKQKIINATVRIEELLEITNTHCKWCNVECFLKRGVLISIFFSGQKSFSSHFIHAKNKHYKIGNI